MVRLARANSVFEEMRRIQVWVVRVPDGATWSRTKAFRAIISDQSLNNETHLQQQRLENWNCKFDCATCLLPISSVSFIKNPVWPHSMYPHSSSVIHCQSVNWTNMRTFVFLLKIAMAHYSFFLTWNACESIDTKWLQMYYGTTPLKTRVAIFSCFITDPCYLHCQQIGICHDGPFWIIARTIWEICFCDSVQTVGNSYSQQNLFSSDTGPLLPCDMLFLANPCPHLHLHF